MENAKKDKRKISWILLLILLLFLITYLFTLFTGSTVEAKGYYYCRLTKNGYEIVGLKKDVPEEIVIPDNFDNKPVVSVASSICSNLPVKSITVPRSVNSIGDKAFENINNMVIIMADRKNADGMKLGKDWSGEATVIFEQSIAVDDLKEKPPEYVVKVIPDKPVTPANSDKTVFVPPIQPDVPEYNPPKKVDGETNNTVKSKTSGGYEISEENKKEVVTLTSVTIDTPPTKTKYIEGNMFDNAGIIVSAHYSDNTSKKITDYVVTKLPLLAGTKTVTVSYTVDGITKNAMQEVEVIKKTPTNLQIVTPPNKIRYIEGNVFDTSGMVVNVSFDNEMNTNITNFEAPKEKLVLGQTSVTLSYTENGKEVTAIQPITVVAKTPTKLEIANMPDKTKYIEGNVFNKTGMVIKAHYDNEDIIVIEDFVVSSEKLIKGQKSITVSYKENGRKVTVDVPITVVAKSPVRLEITSPPFKTRYIEGNIFDMTRMELKAYYDNGDEAVINCFTAPKDKLVKGQSSITISYKENDVVVTVEQPIIVVAKTPIKLEITKPPTKTSYSAGLIFRPEGMVITATYDNGDVAEITSYTYPAERLKEGQGFVTISYKENNGVVTVNVAVTVGPQLAVYQKYNCVLDTCKSCGGRGRTSYTTSCSNCGGDGSVSGSYTCSSCGGKGEWWTNRIYTNSEGIQVYEMERHECSSCGGSGSISYSHSCSTCGGSGTVTRSQTCSTCRGTGSHGYKKTTYISDVTSVYNSLPSDGHHSDGSYYVLKHLIQDEIPKKKEDE